MSTEHREAKKTNLPNEQKHENNKVRHSHGGEEHTHEIPVVATEETYVHEEVAPIHVAIESVPDTEDVAPTARKRISVKTAIIVAVVVILVALGYSYRGVFVAATVDGSPISRLAVIRELEKTSGQAVLESMITKKMIQSAVQKQGITVSAEEVAVDMKKIEEEIRAQGGGSLDLLLAQRGMTRADLEEQLIMQKQVEKLIGEKVAVTPEEVDQYIEQTKTELPKGQEAEAREQIMDMIKQQKLSQEGQTFLGSLRKDASINYIVKYGGSPGL